VAVKDSDVRWCSDGLCCHATTARRCEWRLRWTAATGKS
jgi:hypothetical protein